MFVFILLTIILLAGVFAGLYFYNLVMNRAFNKSAALRALPPMEKRATKEKTIQFLDLPQIQQAAIESFDGLKLHAYYRAACEKWIILQHGYMSSPRAMGGFAQSMYEHGYSVLLPDARGHGESEGSYIGMGWHDRKDILSWIDFILGMEPRAQIALYGISMGGAAVMMAAGEALPKNVKGVIEDCGYSSVKEELLYQSVHTFKIPAFLSSYILFFTAIFTRCFAKFSMDEASSVKQLKKAKLPMLFIHGEADSFVPCAMLKEVYDACSSGDKQMLSFPNAEHSASALADPPRYSKAVYDFLSRIFR